MFKLILIEDDLPVLRHLQKIISGLKSDFELVMTFTHPLDALEYIKSNPVDAVITDIQLPVMTGIELCEYCRTHFPKIKFAILSAYDYFEYAQKAIDLEVVHYVLKPITLKKLEIMLQKLSQKLECTEISEGFAASSVTLKRQQTILNLISGFYSDYSLFFKDMQENDVFIDRQSCPVAVMIITVENLFKILEKKAYYSKEELYKIITNIMDRNNMSLYSVLFNYSENVFTIFIFGKPHLSESDFKISVDEYASSVFSDIKNILNMTPILNSLETFSDIDGFYKAQRQNASYEEQAKNIMSYIYGNDFDAALRCIEAVKMIFDETQARALYACILSHIESLTQKSFTYENMSSEKLFNIIASEINNIKHYNVSQAAKSDVIENACKFINDNFANDITLNDVAKHVFLSPIYFSSYFKKKTGEKYSDYLQKVKLNKARELLEDTDVKIPTIAEMSGFRDTNYFHKIFKNQTGLTPSEYRKKYRREK